MKAPGKILFRKTLRLTGLALAAIFLCRTSFGAETAAFTKDGYALPQPGTRFIFPRDHGSHPEFAIEWWYITGHLTATNHSQFGFQATFFRRALQPPGTTNHSTSVAFGDEQIYLAHMALTDKNTGRFVFQERLNRDGWDAGSSTNTLDVRNGNWSLRLLPRMTGTPEQFELQGSIGADAAFTLKLTARKPLVIFGTNGVSRKAADPSASSHYLTFPRLAVSGNVTVQETNLIVTGEAWMDHEFSSGQLGADQVGWDWLSLQLYDGRELMAYRMRRQDGGTDPFSTVAWIDPAGSVRQTGTNKFNWTSLARWRSPKTGAEYPSKVRLIAENPRSGQSETFLVEPLVADQELAGPGGGVSYWEGACRVLDENQKEIGRAYLELTGYQASLKGKF
jgi:predicted secreted hydrolase